MGYSQSKLSWRELSVLREQTHFNKSELQQWHRVFINESPNGRLDKKHFIKLYTQISKDGADPHDLANYVFEVFDEDKNGYIDFREFICALSTTMRGSSEEKLEWIFQLLDLDGDGEITYDEMLSVLKAGSKMTSNTPTSPKNEQTPEELTKDIFGSLNKDENSKITHNEFLQLRSNSTVMNALSRI